MARASSSATKSWGGAPEGPAAKLKPWKHSAGRRSRLSESTASGTRKRPSAWATRSAAAPAGRSHGGATLLTAGPRNPSRGVRTGFARGHRRLVSFGILARGIGRLRWRGRRVRTPANIARAASGGESSGKRPDAGTAGPIVSEGRRTGPAKELLNSAISVLERNGGEPLAQALETLACAEEQSGRRDEAKHWRDVASNLVAAGC